MFPGKHTTWAAALTTYKRYFVWSNKVVRPSGQIFFPPTEALCEFPGIAYPSLPFESMLCQRRSKVEECG